MKKIVKLMFMTLVFMFLTINTIKVNGAKITIERDENPSGVAVASIYNDEYYVIVDDETLIGYVYHNSLYGEDFLGTCTVILVAEDCSEKIIAYSKIENSLGELKIGVNDLNDLNGIIIDINGDVAIYFEENSNVIISTE